MNVPPFKDNLTQFAEWWMQTRAIKAPLEGAYSRVGGNTGQVVFREGAFQVQLFICDPDSEITDHVHPNVDTYEVYVSGDVYFRKNGLPLIRPEIVTANEDGSCRLLGIIDRVKPADWHGAAIGPRGGCFLSIQEWLNGHKPSSVHLDWDGQPLDAAHAAAVGKEV